MKKSTQAHASMVLSSLLIASAFPVVASISGSMESIVLTLFRFVLAAIVFLPILALRYPKEAVPTWKSLARYAGLSAPMSAYFFIMFESLRTTSSINTGALFTFVPSFAALFAFGLLKDRISGRRLVALFTGMLGAVWVIFRGDRSRLMDMDLASGDALFLFGTACLGLYSVLIKRVHRNEPLVVMTFWTLATGAGWLLLLGWSDLAEVRWSEIEPRVFGAISYLAIGPTFVTFYLTQRAVTVIGPTRTMAYNYLNPSLVALFAWVLGDGSMSWILLPGIALTLVSMAVLQRSVSVQSSELESR